MAKYDISVIIPIHRLENNFNRYREVLYHTSTSVEIIYVVDISIADKIKKKKDNEKILIKDNIGRGYMLQEGASEAQGKIIVFLHADTLLPLKWDELIIQTMENPRVIGGAFDLSFDCPVLYLRLIAKLTTWLFNIIGVLSGDRAIFVQAAQLKNDIHILNLPIFEDAELSRWMQKKGEVVLLKKPVITSAYAFKRHGIIRHTLRIIFCSFWYEIGGDIDKIFNYYYQ